MSVEGQPYIDQAIAAFRQWMRQPEATLASVSHVIAMLAEEQATRSGLPIAGRVEEQLRETFAAWAREPHRRSA